MPNAVIFQHKAVLNMVNNLWNLNASSVVQSPNIFVGAQPIFVKSAIRDKTQGIT